MNNVVRTQGVGRLILKILAIGSALTFLAVVMVNACATHGASPYAAPTKAAPVVHPAPAPAPARAAPPPIPEDDEDEMRAPATKSGRVFRPRRRAPAAQEAAQQQAAPPQQQPAQRQTGAGAP